MRHPSMKHPFSQGYTCSVKSIPKVLLLKAVPSAEIQREKSNVRLAESLELPKLKLFSDFSPQFNP